MTPTVDSDPLAAASPRDLVVCFDGTSNEFGVANTNVVRLVQSLVRDPDRQRVYYDPGIGTFPEPGFVSGVGKKLSEVAGLAFGIGLAGKIAGGYRFLMDHWRAGDRIFVFGFSRGAYTARALAALLHLFGLLPAGSQNLLPYLMRKFMSSSREYLAAGTDTGTAAPGVEPDGPYKTFCAGWRDAFAHAVPGVAERRVPVHFLGVWDTVKSVGWVWEPLSLPFTAYNPGVATVRHAIALDERRAFFRQNRFGSGGASARQDLVERWFPGVHADVGGGYPADQGSLWQAPFCWMIEEAHAHGLAVDAGRLDQVLHGARPVDGDASPGTVADVLRLAAASRAWAGPAHESLRGAWWAAEWFPKMVRTRTDVGGAPVWKGRPRLNRGAFRHVPPDATLDASVIERIAALSSYRPAHAAGARFPDTPAGRAARAALAMR